MSVPNKPSFFIFLHWFAFIELTINHIIVNEQFFFCFSYPEQLFIVYYYYYYH